MQKSFKINVEKIGIMKNNKFPFSFYYELYTVLCFIIKFQTSKTASIPFPAGITPLISLAAICLNILQTGLFRFIPTIIQKLRYFFSCYIIIPEEMRIKHGNVDKE